MDRLARPLGRSPLFARGSFALVSLAKIPSRMPSCYFLAVCAGSSLDQQTNNASLFHLVEQVNVAPGHLPEPGRRLPLEVHCYFRLQPDEHGQEIEMRFALLAPTGLETYTDPTSHRAASARLRTRHVGLSFPPDLGYYELRVDFRVAGGPWQRGPSSWPLAILEARPPRPQVTH